MIYVINMWRCASKPPISLPLDNWLLIRFDLPLFVRLHMGIELKVIVEKLASTDIADPHDLIMSQHVRLDLIQILHRFPCIADTVIKLSAHFIPPNPNAIIRLVV